MKNKYFKSTDIVGPICYRFFIDGISYYSEFNKSVRTSITTIKQVEVLVRNKLYKEIEEADFLFQEI